MVSRLALQLWPCNLAPAEGHQLLVLCSSADVTTYRDMLAAQCARVFMLRLRLFTLKVRQT